jgi:SAM-dependent methyltransferase
MSLSQSEKEQRDYYNRIAGVYESHYGNPQALRYRGEVFDRFLPGENFEGLQVLDAMCGGGENSVYFHSRGASVTGVDISEAQCEFFQKRFPDASAVCASILQSGLPSESFDLVVTESLHHLHPHVQAATRELIRVLKPGGKLLVWEPSSGSLLDLARKLWYRLDSEYFEDNEASIDFRRLNLDTEDHLDCLRLVYGGNFAHFLVMSSMQFRIPPGLVRWYAPFLLWLEPWVEKLQGRLLSSWGLALYRKRETQLP